jgi:hypothetical protein
MPHLTTPVSLQQAVECGYANADRLGQAPVQEWALPPFATLAAMPPHADALGDSLLHSLLIEVVHEATQDAGADRAAQWDKAQDRLRTMRQQLDAVVAALRHFAPPGSELRRDA